MIEIKHLTHRYPGADKNALEDITFTIEKGKSLASWVPAVQAKAPPRQSSPACSHCSKVRFRWMAFRYQTR